MKNILFLLLISTQVQSQNSIFVTVSKLLKKEILKEANKNKSASPITVTNHTSERSAGGKHDFFSEGDYWWPDSAHPNGPYIQKDGLTNPNNFTDHRKAMIRFSKIVANQTSAYLITSNKTYATQAIKHIKAWLVDTATRMNPSLLYAQAIKGKVTGRGIGVIDMIQMIEVAKSVEILEKDKLITPKESLAIHQWFKDYLLWVNTHPYGIEEREAKNNHGTCWVMQVAAFAHLVQDSSLLHYCKQRFVTTILPNQMDANGSFPLELKRTKPYGYSIFNVDAVLTIAAIFKFEVPPLQKAIEFIYPYIKNKNTWPYPKDVMYWEQWPVASPVLLFGYMAYGNTKWLDTWSPLNHFPKNEEVIRNLPIRNPLIWIEK